MNKFNQARQLLNKLYDAKRIGGFYAMRDVAEWLEHDLDALGYLLDEIENEQTPDYPDQQILLNAEIEQVNEGRIPA